MSDFVYGNETRIFVNTDMGCDSGCCYCYLPGLQIEHNRKRITVQEAIELVEKSGYYKRGRKGTLISIGCYSECMDKSNEADTIKLVQYFLEQGNCVQLATKRKLEPYFFERIQACEGVKERLWVYVSMPVITASRQLEPGTDTPEDRIENICKQFGIHCVLYIKLYRE